MMKHSYSFYSQSICMMGACGQCSGEGYTLYEAIRNFGPQIGGMIVSIEHVLSGWLDK